MFSGLIGLFIAICSYCHLPVPIGKQLHSHLTILILGLPTFFVLWAFRTHDTKENINNNAFFSALSLLSNKETVKQGLVQLMYLRNNRKVLIDHIDNSTKGLSISAYKGANESKIDLTSLDLTGINLTNARLIDVDLSNTKLIGAKLINCEFSNCFALKGDFTNADLTKSKFNDGSFNEVDFEGSIFFNASLNDTNFSGSKMRKIRSFKSLRIAGEPTLKSRKDLPESYTGKESCFRYEEDKNKKELSIKQVERIRIGNEDIKKLYNNRKVVWEDPEGKKNFIIDDVKKIMEVSKIIEKQGLVPHGYEIQTDTHLEGNTGKLTIWKFKINRAEQDDFALCLFYKTELSSQVTKELDKFFRYKRT